MTTDSDASSIPHPEKKRPKPRQIVWMILAVMFIISLVLSVLSAGNYTEIAKASALTHVVTTDSAVIGLDENGNPESVNMTIDFTVVNPSQREIRVWILTYKGWVRDIPLETGLDKTRWRIDGSLEVNGTEQMYYPIFAVSFSFDNPKIIIPADSNFTITRNIVLNRTNYPDIMSEFEKIYNQTADGELEWLQYTSSILFINDIPELSDYYREAGMIRRFDGVDVTPGVGGASP